MTTFRLKMDELEGNVDELNQSELDIALSARQLRFSEGSGMLDVFAEAEAASAVPDAAPRLPAQWRPFQTRWPRRRRPQTANR